VHQPALLRAPSNPIRLTKALQVFWKTLHWSYGNLIAWGIEAFTALVAVVVPPGWSLHMSNALEFLEVLLRLNLVNPSHLFPIHI
jgi:hypothetical protein